MSGATLRYPALVQFLRIRVCSDVRRAKTGVVSLQFVVGRGMAVWLGGGDVTLQGFVNLSGRQVMRSSDMSAVLFVLLCGITFTVSVCPGHREYKL